MIPLHEVTLLEGHISIAQKHLLQEMNTMDKVFTRLLVVFGYVEPDLHLVNTVHGMIHSGDSAKLEWAWMLVAYPHLVSPECIPVRFALV